MSTPTNREDEKPRKKIQPTLFGIKNFEVTQKATRKVGTNQHEVIGEFARVEKGEAKRVSSSHQCKFCTEKFKTPNALGAHQVHCERKKQCLRKKSVDPTKETSCMLLQSTCETAHGKRNRKEMDDRNSEKISNATTSCEHSTSRDQRFNNRGSAIRKSHSARHKVEFVDQVNEHINQHEDTKRTATSYFKNVMNARESEIQALSNNYYKWNRKDAYETCLRKLVNLPSNSSGPAIVRKTVIKSPFHDVETELHVSFLNVRRAGRKVSARFLRLQGKRIFDRMKAENPNKWGDIEFRGTYGWMHRFIKRKNVKFRKRKCGKEKTIEECVHAFEMFLEKVRFEFLCPREGDDNAVRECV